MFKNFFSFTISLLLVFEAVHGYIKKAPIDEFDFFCPPKGAKKLEPTKLENVNCSELNIECAKRHQDNELILKEIRSLKCNESTISTTLLQESQNIVLSVLREDVAVRLLERQVCSEMDGMICIHSKNYIHIAKRNMFFRNIFCSQILVEMVLSNDFMKSVHGIFKHEPQEQRIIDQKFREKLRGIFQIRLFQGILSTNEPYLSGQQIELLIDQIYFAFDDDVRKTVKYISKMMDSNYRKPLRNELNSDGTYKDYEKSSNESYVHVCQAVRQNFFPGLMTAIDEVSKQNQDHETKTRKEKLEIKLKLIEFCDKLIDDESYFALKVYFFSVGPVLLIAFILAYRDIKKTAKEMKYLQDSQESGNLVASAK